MVSVILGLDPAEGRCESVFIWTYITFCMYTCEKNAILLLRDRLMLIPCSIKKHNMHTPRPPVRDLAEASKYGVQGPYDGQQEQTEAIERKTRLRWPDGPSLPSPRLSPVRLTITALSSCSGSLEKVRESIMESVNRPVEMLKRLRDSGVGPFVCKGGVSQ